MLVLKVIGLSVATMAFVFLGLAVQILLKKGGKFPNTHVGSNKYMKSHGVTCATTFDKIEQAKARGIKFRQLAIDDQESENYFC
jgi:hypothetical protein